MRSFSGKYQLTDAFKRVRRVFIFLEKTTIRFLPILKERTDHVQLQMGICPNLKPSRSQRLHGPTSNTAENNRLETPSHPEAPFF